MERSIWHALVSAAMTRAHRKERCARPCFRAPLSANFALHISNRRRSPIGRALLIITTGRPRRGLTTLGITLREKRCASFPPPSFSRSLDREKSIKARPSSHVHRSISIFGVSPSLFYVRRALIALLSRSATVALFASGDKSARTVHFCADIRDSEYNKASGCVGACFFVGPPTLTSAFHRGCRSGELPPLRENKRKS